MVLVFMDASSTVNGRTEMINMQALEHARRGMRTVSICIRTCTGFHCSTYVHLCGMQYRHQRCKLQGIERVRLSAGSEGSC